MARKFDLIPGTEYDGLIVGIGALALIFVASQGWREDAWVKAASTGGPAAATLMWSKAKEEKEVEIAKKKAWDEGYNTINPALRVDEIIEKARSPVSTIGAAVAEKVAEQAVEVATDYAVEEIKDWFEDPEPEPRERMRREQRRETDRRQRRQGR